METTIINITVPPPEPVNVEVTTPAPQPVTVEVIENIDEVNVTVQPPTSQPVLVEVTEVIETTIVNVSAIGEKGDPGPQGESADFTSFLFGETPIGIVNGSNATFTSPLPFIPGKLNVFVNGLLQKPVTHYQTTGINTIIFSDSPQPPDEILLNYIKS